MIQLIPVICPRCHATLEVEPGRDSIYCMYCGLHVLIDDSNEQKFTYHTIDEARIREVELQGQYREAELEQRVHMLEMQLEEKKHGRMAGLVKPAVIAGSVVTVAGVALTMFGDDDGGGGIMALCVGLLILMLALMAVMMSYADKSGSNGRRR